MTWHIYLARCADGSLYTGIAVDPLRRLAAHNSGRGAAYTRSRRPVTIAHLETAPSRSAALKREWQIKQLPRAEKERLAAAAPRRRSAGGFRGFERDALDFLAQLARHNEKAWFERNRARYDQSLRAPLAELVGAMDVRLARLAPELVGDPRRSIFRLHRDLRFSADKSPYKTSVACHFFHRDAGRGAGRAAAAGAVLYLQLAPGRSFVAGGIWMPPRQTLGRIRDAIADHPDGFAAVVEGRAFRRRFGGLESEGMRRRLPRGYAPGHAAERWLRYQSFTVSRPLDDTTVLGPRLAATLGRDFAALVPLVRWLNAAIGYPAAETR